jgi:hypothetical protein
MGRRSRAEIARDLLVVQRARDLLVAAAREAIAEHRAG